MDHGPLAPEDLRVEFVLGRRERDGRPGRSVVVPMDPAGAPEGARRRYEVSCCMRESGSFACGVRVRVRQEGPPDPALADLVVWA